MTRDDDCFELYDLKVEVVAGDRPMICDHQVGDYFHVIGEMIIFPDGARPRFPMYPLAALLPLLPAKQRPTAAHDWMTTDAEVACPDPHCGGRFRITRLAKRSFSHAETTAAPLPPGSPGTVRDSTVTKVSAVDLRPKVPVVDLRPGYRISSIIKGGWQLAGDHGTVDRTAAIGDMAAFVDAGITTFDCADIYTGVEEMIGVFLDDIRRTRGADAAGNIHVHTKFVPDATALEGISRGQVEAGIDRSLARLGVEQLDLVQFHWWDYEVPGVLDTLGHLQNLQAKGKIRHIGLTNFDLEHVAMFVRAGIDIVSVQVQYSLIDHRPAGAFAAFCREHDIAIFAYGVLAGGFFSERWLGAADPGYGFENRSLIKYRLIIDAFGGWSLFQELLQALSAIAARRRVSLANVALRAMHDHADLAAVILGARYAHHLSDNLRAFDITLGEQDRDALATVLVKRYGPTGPVFGMERDQTTLHGQIFKKNLNAGDG